MLPICIAALSATVVAGRKWLTQSCTAAYTKTKGVLSTWPEWFALMRLYLIGLPLVGVALLAVLIDAMFPVNRRFK